ncbi:helix-turn-helix domain-containing protein [Pedobacter nyackensis]|uniref:Helix-turn-helix domain-containing protein n=1 Tax=Pedobacter nyackensis TaxID=475255 RepID=A0A1W2DT50_9SPHI|nr:AraC family transcriptional regulator [Pedobacter nyackensis]SMD00587.1 Helix-turn-helix domain-containing protein [Pedobacter nyackensis]
MRMILYVKNMVCDRCIMIVRQQLENFGLRVNEISLGKIEVEPSPDANQLQDIATAMQSLGFELIDKEKDQLVEQIKNQVVELVHYSDLTTIGQSLTQTIADRLNKDYAYLSRQFSEAEGLTIEKYIIQQKIEKVKELMEYGELNLNEIAFKMGYSSSAHLSTQFKTITGFTPSKYKSAQLNNRKPLDKVK